MLFVIGNRIISISGDRHKPDNHVGDGHLVCLSKSDKTGRRKIRIEIISSSLTKVSESLPATSYIKMIDGWLIFNLIIPFVLIMIHTFMDTLREYVEQALASSARR